MTIIHVSSQHIATGRLASGQALCGDGGMLMLVPTDSVLLILTLGGVCPLVHYLVHLSLFLYLYNGSNVYI